MKFFYTISLLITFFSVGCASTESPKEPILEEEPIPVKYPIAMVETRIGAMYFWMFDETPNHKAKFIELANQAHYDSFTFNRVVTDFVIQGGCPDSASYFEGSPYLIDPEFVAEIEHKYGALGMGRDDNPGKQSNACQFYIVNNEAGTHRLNGDYVIFGKIIHGEEVLESIESEPTDETNTPLMDIPLKVTIKAYTAQELETLFNFKI